MTAATPITGAERIQEIDIIRGFALFGVLWMNLVAHQWHLAPSGAFDHLATARIDALIEPVASFFVTGKAMAMFSLLFGFGFAMILHRLEARGLDGDRIFLRRMGVLLAIGLIHIWFVWFGDILHVYALMGFAVFMMRKVSDRTLLIGGLFLALFSYGITELVVNVFYDEPFPWWQVHEDGAARRFALLQGNDYLAFQRELWRTSWDEMWGEPFVVPYMTTTLGRFMLGAWIFRQGWLQRSNQYGRAFRHWAAILLPIGLTLAFVEWKLGDVSESLVEAFYPTVELVLALAYSACIISLCQSPAITNAFAGVGDVGRMALTNYLMQSVMYFFVLYGFGLGLLTQLGATMCLAIAVATFAAQIVFSRWWLARCQFGPMEWVWRSLTYGSRQPIAR
jgi:uncharacterized protein